MRKFFPFYFNFFPKSFILPRDYDKLQKYGKMTKCQFIAKPKFSAEGRGIRLYLDYKQIDASISAVVQ